MTNRNNALRRRLSRFSIRALLAFVLVAAIGCAVAAYIYRAPTARAKQFFAAIQRGDLPAAEAMLSEYDRERCEFPWRNWSREQLKRALFRFGPEDPYLRWGERHFTIEVVEDTNGFRQRVEYLFYSRREGIQFWAKMS